MLSTRIWTNDSAGQREKNVSENVRAGTQLVTFEVFYLKEGYSITRGMQHWCIIVLVLVLFLSVGSLELMGITLSQKSCW